MVYIPNSDHNGIWYMAPMSGFMGSPGPEKAIVLCTSGVQVPKKRVVIPQYAKTQDTPSFGSLDPSSVFHSLEVVLAVPVPVLT